MQGFGRILRFVGDAYTPEVRDQIWEVVDSTTSGGFDLIVDDGSHHFAHQLAAIRLYIPLLADGGVMVIEDIKDASSATLLADVCTDLFPAITTRIIDRRAALGTSGDDDIMLVIDLAA